ncbi:farnesyl pyrophosphate synthase-like isoform X1 [Pseudophryne corroboree]|uniref:farnesyl pyrophosphate synthase-like isoform X1 n=1 Tax=Pseudophryne corroboree TaxID=495146 RepID=UPI0030818054
MAPVKASSASDDFHEFSSLFERVVQDLTAEECGNPEIGVAMSRLREVLEYNVRGGKYNRGTTVVASVRELLPLTLQDVETIERALVVGWCIELLSQFFIVADDIMDKSETRRGKLCWYKKEGIGLDAINDSFLLESCTYRLLRKHCSGQSYYLNLLELFLETSYQVELGQALDLIGAQPGKMDLDQYTETRYKAIAKYKAGVFCFYLPIAAAMLMAGIDQEEDHKNAKTILLQMGELYQVQNDYLDCYGDPSIIGKIGTDIQDKKCTWLVVEALKRVTPEQRRILEENYGYGDVDKVQKVKQLYNDLGLSAVYRQYEEESYQRLQTLISQHANGLPKEIFLGLAHKIWRF